jgi:hypothetical protein
VYRPQWRPSPWPARSRPEAGSGPPADERPAPAVARRLDEHRLPDLAAAAGTGDPDVSPATAATGGFPGRLAGGRRPARLRLAWPQLMAERAQFRLVFEQGGGHLDDHARTSCHESMITLTAPGESARTRSKSARTVPQAREPPRRGRVGQLRRDHRPDRPITAPLVPAIAYPHRTTVAAAPLLRGCLADLLGADQLS